jgi:cytidine deaminase
MHFKRNRYVETEMKEHVRHDDESVDESFPRNKIQKTGATVISFTQAQPSSPCGSCRLPLASYPGPRPRPLAVMATREAGKQGC